MKRFSAKDRLSLVEHNGCAANRRNRLNTFCSLKFNLFQIVRQLLPLRLRGIFSTESKTWYNDMHCSGLARTFKFPARHRNLASIRQRSRVQ
jgi:hypothetical protein